MRSVYSLIKSSLARLYKNRGGTTSFCNGDICIKSIADKGNFFFWQACDILYKFKGMARGLAEKLGLSAG